MQEISYLRRYTLRGAWIEIYIVQVKLARPAPTPQKGKPGRGFLCATIKPVGKPFFHRLCSPPKKEKWLNI